VEAAAQTESTPGYLEAQRTLIEQYFITTALRRAGPKLVERLAWLLSGSDTPDEDRHTTPRDVQFELFVAGVLVHGGVLDVSLGEPDLRIRAGNQFLGVAVKRLSSNRQMTRRLSEAVQQLRRAGLQGFIVMNLDSFASSRPPHSARQACADQVHALRLCLEDIRAADVVGGIIGFATTAATIPEQLSHGDARTNAIQICCDAEFIAFPGDDVEEMRRRLTVIGRNLVRGVNTVVGELDARALQLTVEREMR
jgi:hypothetical protein